MRCIHLDHLITLLMSINRGICPYRQEGDNTHTQVRIPILQALPSARQVLSYSASRTPENLLFALKKWLLLLLLLPLLYLQYQPSNSGNRSFHRINTSFRLYRSESSNCANFHAPSFIRFSSSFRSIGQYLVGTFENFLMLFSSYSWTKAFCERAEDVSFAEEPIETFSKPTLES